MTPLERAARALHRARMAGQHPKPDNYPWEDLPRRSQALLRRDAYAVIEAIREPSMVMMDAGTPVMTDPIRPASVVYQVMIDALLEEGK